MGMDIFTQVWMGGVIAFGVIFYYVAVRYAQASESESE